jgi:hypothetical protein
LSAFEVTEVGRAGIHGSSFLFPRRVVAAIAGLERGEEPGGAKGLRLIQIRFSDAEFGKKLASLSR